MYIPYQELNQQTLRNLVREFILREGTDYGSEEVAMDTKIDQIVRQLKDGKVSIVYDDYTKSCSIVPEHK